MALLALLLRLMLLSARARRVAMKKNPVTGEMEEFHSRALQDDLPDEEAETAEVEVPVGDDY
jgi:hypothetical protein